MDFNLYYKYRLQTRKTMKNGAKNIVHKTRSVTGLKIVSITIIILNIIKLTGNG